MTLTNLLTNVHAAKCLEKGVLHVRCLLCIILKPICKHAWYTKYSDVVIILFMITTGVCRPITLYGVYLLYTVILIVVL